MKVYESLRLVEYKDANHHGTLFAASGAAWAVEMGFTTAGCLYKDTAGLVCRGVESLTFQHPVNVGTVLRLTGEVIKAGTTSLTVRVTAAAAGEETAVPAIEAIITFVTIDPDTRQKKPHGIVL